MDGSEWAEWVATRVGWMGWGKVCVWMDRGVGWGVFICEFVVGEGLFGMIGSGVPCTCD
jgi:hypothetical protein